MIEVRISAEGKEQFLEELSALVSLCLGDPAVQVTPAAQPDENKEWMKEATRQEVQSFPEKDGATSAVPLEPTAVLEPAIVVTAPEPEVDFVEIARLGGRLCSASKTKREACQALLQKYGAQSLSEVAKQDLPALAAELRALAEGG